MQAIGFTAWGYAAICAIWGLHKGHVRIQTLRYTAFVLLAASMTVTTALVITQGLDVLRTLLPLHLCSACAVLSLFFYARPTRAAFEFLFYAGMPGAALALCFPAVAVSRYQDAMDACFFLTHALIVFAPVLHIAAGYRPREKAAPLAYGVLTAFAVLVYAVNRMIGANYLFLMAAPAGTPLAVIYRMGRGAYWAALAVLALGVVFTQRYAARRLSAHKLPVKQEPAIPHR